MPIAFRVFLVEPFVIDISFSYSSQGNSVHIMLLTSESLVKFHLAASLSLGEERQRFML